MFVIVCMYLYIYIYDIYICVCVCVSIQRHWKNGGFNLGMSGATQLSPIAWKPLQRFSDFHCGTAPCWAVSQRQMAAQHHSGTVNHDLAPDSVREIKGKVYIETRENILLDSLMRGQ